jgi:hypothetical protein
MSYGLNRITPSGGSALDSTTAHNDAATATHDTAAAAAAACGFEVGTRVVIRGLKAQPEFNGCAGKIVTPEENGRWGVELDQGDCIKVSACVFCKFVDLCVPTPPHHRHQVRRSNLENCVIALQDAVSGDT